ncbi:MAG: hypothetical protein MJ188_08390 [Treponema sp.]|nr:hypothetical protein [Treponema sp.]
MNNDSLSGYKKLENTKGFTTEQLMEKLQNITVSFGKPVMGEITKMPAVTYKIDRFTVYVMADEKKIQIGASITENLGKNLIKELGIAFLTGTVAGGKDNAEADRAVEELYDIVTQILNGTEEVKTHTLTGNVTKLYMKQKVFTLADEYNICTEDETPVYWVKSDLVHLNFRIEKEKEEILSIKKKLIAVLPEYTIFQDGQEIGTLKKKFKLTKPEINGTINGKSVSIAGDLMGNNYAIIFDGITVGAVDTQRLTWGDCYSIDVREPHLQDLVVTTAIIVDNALASAVK